MAATSCFSRGLIAVLVSASTFSISFCGSNVVPQFFCVFPTLLKTSCSEDHVATDMGVTSGSISFPACVGQLLLVILFVASEMFIFTAMSYDHYVVICCPLLYNVVIFNLTLIFCGSHIITQFFCDIPSLLKTICSKNHFAIDVSAAIGSSFFIFLPHLLVITVFFTTDAFDHLKPPSDTSPTLDLLESVLYTLVPPSLNILIYSLRN
ncbi:olfactory receptor 14K1-like [Tachyglossus aculeatus]|uniref:olfactory receptor 14K1-like n=1 Tax=Tachyglossus aculeatus TaxID=9261 RepID=UPI0018F64CC1|nr:olfactory receptor 14K1-like [Tachyglossus aculeatus]